MTDDTRTDEELLGAARNGDEAALAVLVERHRDRLECMVRARMDRRLQGRVDPADVVQDAYLAVRGKFPQYTCRLAPALLPVAAPGSRPEACGRPTASTSAPRCATPGRKSRCTAGCCRR